LGDPETHEAIVVDPGDDVDRILEILKRHKLKTRAIVSTHTHIDHVGGLAQLHKATGAPVLIHEADLPLYQSLDMQAEWLGIPPPEIVQIKDFVKEGDSLRWGPFAARVIHTPGHTEGSISLLVEPDGALAPAVVAKDAVATAAATTPASEKLLLAGDTLFQRSIGRTDLPGGSLPTILRSIHDKLMRLPDDLVVFPGHGSTTTIGEEREENPFLR
jgi:glyoxylase-like metal-dependent hydrolase (beta-lactamase superfamily II)